MNKLIFHIKNSILIKVASLNTLSIFTRVVTGFVVSKVIAIYVGAEGLALIGNFRNFSTSIKSFSTLGLSNGIVKYVAELRFNILEISKLVSTVFYMLFFSTAFVSLGCFFYAEELNKFIFTPQDDYSYIIKLLAIMLPFFSANVLLFSLLNGFSRFKRILWINILAQILTTGLSVFLIWKKNIDGALIATVVAEALIFGILLINVFKECHFLSYVKFNLINLSYVKKISSYSIMSLFTAAFLPLVIVAIRNYIIDTIGQEQAGYWEAMNRISNYYLMFVSSLFTLYLLPRFSEINNTKEFRNEVFGFYKTIVPIFAFGLVLIYLLRSFIVRLIFTNSFAPVEDLFLWQLLGDFIKVLSLVISYQFLAKKMVKHYLIVESFSVIVRYVSSIYFIDLFGVKGAVIAHFVNYVLHFAIILLIFKSSLFSVVPDER